MLYALDLDIWIRKHTEDSIACRTPAIQQLAARHNSICLRLQNHLLWKVHSTVGLPTPLDVDQLFNTEANPEMWLETGLDEDDPIQPPRYLYDEGVKSGISAMLMKDWAEEEWYQLESELKIMISWINSSLQAVEAAIAQCTGGFAPFFIIIQPQQLIPSDQQMFHCHINYRPTRAPSLAWHQ